MALPGAGKFKTVKSVVNRGALGLFAALAAVMMRVPAAEAARKQAAAPVKEKSAVELTISFEGRDPLPPAQMAQSLLVTGSVLGGLVVLATKKADKEDKLEEIRIKDETERLDNLKDEFMDVDGESESDEGLLSSLKARLGKGLGNNKDGGAGPDGAGGSSGGPTPPPPSDGGAGGAAPTQEDIDRLNKMFGSGGGEGGK